MDLVVSLEENQNDFSLKNPIKPSKKNHFASSLENDISQIVKKRKIIEEKVIDEYELEPFPEFTNFDTLLATKECAENNYELGMCCEFGNGVEKNMDLAFIYYNVAATQGHAK